MANYLLEVWPDAIDKYAVKIFEVVAYDGKNSTIELKRVGWRILGNLFSKMQKQQAKTFLDTTVLAWSRDFKSIKIC